MKAMSKSKGAKKVDPRVLFKWIKAAQRTLAEQKLHYFQSDLEVETSFRVREHDMYPVSHPIVDRYFLAKYSGVASVAIAVGTTSRPECAQNI